MASFGVRLRQEREKKSVSLDDISLSTKISTRMLRALEEERFDQLPGGIFNKGFIRAYARCVGLDEEQAVADYIAATAPATSGKKPEIEAAPLPEPPPREPDPTAGLPWGMFAVALLAVALAFVVWSYYSGEAQKNSADSTAPTATVPDASQTPAEEAPTAPRENNAAVPAIAEPVQPTPSSPAATAPSPDSAISPPVVVPNQASPVRNTGLTLIIKARQDSWVSISIDGEVNTESTLTASTQRTVHASEEIVVRAGNVGALDFIFNGKKLPSQGDLSQVKTLTFKARGLQATTPKPAPPTP